MKIYPTSPNVTLAAILAMFSLAGIFQILTCRERAKTKDIRAKTEVVEKRTEAIMQRMNTINSILTFPQDLKFGCTRDKDGSVMMACLVLLKHTETDTGVCILDDNTVCLGKCLICYRKINGKWQEVSGWVTDSQDFVLQEPKISQGPGKVVPQELKIIPAPEEAENND